MHGRRRRGVAAACRRMSNSANSSWRTNCMPLWKFFAASILSKSARGMRSPVSTWRVMWRDHVPFPAEVLHELAGQLDRVPLDAVDARHAELVDLREQLVQPVAELVEQRVHLAVREERGLAAHGRREVAGEEGDRRLHAPADAPAVDGVVHPRPAALALARVEVEVELADARARGVDDLEEAHRRVPGLGLRPARIVRP